MKKTILITALITAIICCSASFIISQVLLPTVGKDLRHEDGRYLVEVRASSSVYDAYDAAKSCGSFLDIFDDIKDGNESLEEMIDNGCFPYTIVAKAVTTPSTDKDGTTPPTRYLIETKSGELYWVEP